MQNGAIGLLWHLWNNVEEYSTVNGVPRMYFNFDVYVLYLSFFFWRVEGGGVKIPE